jgi:hypothetical protein
MYVTDIHRIASKYAEGQGSTNVVGLEPMFAEQGVQMSPLHPNLVGRFGYIASAAF